MNNFLTLVEKTICKQKLLQSGDSVLVALSGGADSVCLLSCLKELSQAFNLSVAAAHLHHGLRGDEADGDEEFCRTLCMEWGIPFHSTRQDIRLLAKEKGIGIEEAGRMARYSFFKQLQEACGYSKVATAHHGNDNVETVLMRIIRGTGVLGLGGIPYQNGDVIRPLLDVTRSDIMAYLSKKGYSYRIDRSNEENVYTRNRIRNQLIPELESSFNPGFQKTFLEQIRLYSACGTYIKDEAGKLFKRHCALFDGAYGFSLEKLSSENPFLVSTMVQQLLENLTPGKGVSSQNIEAVMTLVAEQSGRVMLPGNMVAEVCHDKLYIRRNVPFLPISPVPLSAGVCKKLSDGQIVSCDIVDTVPEKINKNEIYLDLKTVSDKEILLRSRQDGDSFCPVGMSGTKKLQDFFVDEKVPYFLRDRIPLVTVGDSVAWIVGYRADRRFVATKGQNQCLCITVHKGDFC